MGLFARVNRRIALFIFELAGGAFDRRPGGRGALAFLATTEPKYRPTVTGTGVIVGLVGPCHVSRTIRNHFDGAIFVQNRLIGITECAYLLALSRGIY
jgi:hypothetical protein